MAIKLQTVNYNPTEAKELLAQAGWIDNDGDGYVDKNGQKLILRWLTYPGRQELPLLAEIAQANLKTIGIDLKINNTINQQEFLASGNWDIYVQCLCNCTDWRSRIFLHYTLSPKFSQKSW